MGRQCSYCNHGEVKLFGTIHLILFHLAMVFESCLFHKCTLPHVFLYITSFIVLTRAAPSVGQYMRCRTLFCMSPVYPLYYLGPVLTHTFPGSPQIPPRLTTSSILRVSTPAEASTLTPQSEPRFPALLLNSPKEARSSTIPAAGARAGLERTIIG
jgi:hypothetical protein